MNALDTQSRAETTNTENIVAVSYVRVDRIEVMCIYSIADTDAGEKDLSQLGFSRFPVSLPQTGLISCDTRFCVYDDNWRDLDAHLSEESTEFA
jgi:hypothetical protein